VRAFGERFGDVRHAGGRGVEQIGDARIELLDPLLEAAEGVMQGLGKAPGRRVAMASTPSTAAPSLSVVAWYEARNEE
jgi:hypothetical protein